MKFHLTPDGPRPCSATKRPCPVGGEHFQDSNEARKAYEKSLASVQVSSRKVGLPLVALEAEVKWHAGGLYLACPIGVNSVEAHLSAFRAHVGPERAAAMEANKAKRDRGYVYHLTVTSPQETKALDRTVELPTSVTVRYEGVGRAQRGEDEAWFVVCSSPELEEWRGGLGLPPKDFHITLGFDRKDVHGETKDSSSIVIR